MHKPDDIAKRLLGAPLAQLGVRERRVAQHVAARNVAHDTAAAPTRGQRAADAVASFGGSWTFVMLFGATLLSWVLLNLWLVQRRGDTFDPYPFTLLNRFLSMLAAVQAHIILMAQNRQSQRDRISAEHDYEVNLTAELEIMLLHEKRDTLREKQWAELLDIGAAQSRLLASLLARAQPQR